MHIKFLSMVYICLSDDPMRQAEGVTSNKHKPNPIPIPNINFKEVVIWNQ